MAGRNPLAAVAHGHTLAEAIVDTVREPLVVLDRDLGVIAASRSFYQTFAAEPQKTEGRMLYELGDGQWNIPTLRTVLEDVIRKLRTVEAYEVEHEFPTIGRRVMLLNARQVFDEDGSGSALLLAIEDVTQRRDADREKDEQLRQKEVLLQEMQHRVANSLQIIASILLLKARTVKSEEIRLHLHDTHQRVMSVATVQQQLQASGLNESIEIGPYLCKLCDSLEKSMVGERRPLSIKVQATSGRAVSSEAVSLGLIVTELWQLTPYGKPWVDQTFCGAQRATISLRRMRMTGHARQPRQKWLAATFAGSRTSAQTTWPPLAARTPPLARWCEISVVMTLKYHPALPSLLTDTGTSFRRTILNR